MRSSAQAKSALKAQQLQHLHSHSNCEHLQEELQSSVSSQQALRQTVQELQTALAVVKDQTSPRHTTYMLAPNHEHSMHRQTPRQVDQQPVSVLHGNVSEVSPSGGVVAALQQQVLELRAISAHLEQYQQHQALTPTEERQSASTRDTANLHGCVDRTNTSQRPGFRHSCSSAQHSPLPQHEPLSQSVCQSPASCSHVHQSIRAHHGMQHSTEDKCWCGRPKRGPTSILSTPMQQIQTDQQQR